MKRASSLPFQRVYDETQAISWYDMAVAPVEDVDDIPTRIFDPEGPTQRLDSEMTRETSVPAMTGELFVT